MSDGKKDKPSASKNRPNIDPDFVRELASLLEETGLTEIEVEESGTRVRVGRQVSGGAASAPAPAPTLGTAPATEVPATPQRGTVVASPMVGTAYLGAEPGAPPFVKVGDEIHEGQTLIIVEAMKTMNQVSSPVSGRVVEISVQDGQPVEFGEPLVRID